MEIRQRACGALIVGDSILMVRHQEPGRTFWTLPGGGLEDGETFAEAAVREMLEETGLGTRVVRLLWADGGVEECYLLELEGENSVERLGEDPEEAHLAAADRQLQGVEWRALGDVATDVQVSRVLAVIGDE